MFATTQTARGTMQRTTTTMILEDLGCAGGSARSLERMLAGLSGVTRAYVNPVLDVAYVEFDADRCSETDMIRAAESLGIHAVPSGLSPYRAPPMRGGGL